MRSTQVTSADFQCFLFCSRLKAASKTDSGLVAYDSESSLQGHTDQLWMFATSRHIQLARHSQVVMSASSMS